MEIIESFSGESDDDDDDVDDADENENDTKRSHDDTQVSIHDLTSDVQHDNESSDARNTLQNTQEYGEVSNAAI